MASIQEYVYLILSLLMLIIFYYFVAKCVFYRQYPLKVPVLVWIAVPMLSEVLSRPSPVPA
jgi:hypothetical protein